MTDHSRAPSVDPAERNPLGTHVPVSGGLARGALGRAEQLGCETIQVFTGNPRGWAHSPGKPADDAAFAEQTRSRGMRTFIHTPYLVNLGSPTAATYEKSVDVVAHTLQRARETGVEGVVVHTGSYVDPSGDPGLLDAAMTRVRDGLLPLLEQLGTEGEDAPWLLLEPTAGQGRSLCGPVADLADYLAALDHHPRAGVCLDTCHALAAGDPLDEPGGMRSTLDALVRVAGEDRLRLVHANDSVDGRGSLRDRHERIGEGRLADEAFDELFAHPATAGVPVIAETPGSREPGNTCLPRLREVRAEVWGSVDS